MSKIVARRRLGIEPLESRIVPVLNPANGYNPAPANFFPAVCRIVGENTSGTGTLIAPQWVLTATHVISSTWTEDLRIHINGQVYHAIERFGVHELVYGFDTWDYEVALVKLAQPVSGVQPIPIYRSALSVGEQVILVGYGRSDNGTYVEQKDTGGVRRAGVTSIDVLARSTFGDYSLYRLRFNGGSESFTGRGDSGGPLLVRKDGRYYVAGIVSHFHASYWIEGPSSNPTDYGAKIGTYSDNIRTDFMGFWIDEVMRTNNVPSYNIRQANPGGSQQPGLQDVTPPVIVAPGSIERYSTSASGAIVEFTDVAVSDDFDLFPSIQYSHPSGSLFPVGTTPVTVTATDVSGNVGTRTFEVVVLPGNPVVIVDDYLVDRKNFDVGVGNGVLANDSSPIGRSLRAVLDQQPANGTVVLNDDGSFLYVPNAGFVGNDSFSYFVEDGSHPASSPVVVTLRVTHPPVVAADSFLVLADQSATVDASSGVLANDFSVYDHPLTATLLSDVSHGQLTFASDGSFTYAPDPGFSGTDSFTYRAHDGSLTSDVVEVTLTVGYAPTGTPDEYHLAQNRVFSVDAWQGVLSNDFDQDGGFLSITRGDDPAHGWLSLGANGDFIYEPAPGFVGEDSFTYYLHDGQFASGPILVSLIVERPPEAMPDSWYVYYSEELNVPASQGLLANDVDHYGRPLRVELLEPPSQGDFVLEQDGAFTYWPSYSPYDVGTVTFTYRVWNDLVASDPTTVTLNTWSMLAEPDSFVFGFSPLGHRKPPYNGSGLTWNDVILGSAPPNAYEQLRAELVSAPNHGSLVLQDNGSFTYDSGDYHGTDGFAYRMLVGEHTSEAAPVSITVPPQTPRADRYDSGEFDWALVIPAEQGLLANDVHGTGDPLQVMLVGYVNAGWLDLRPDGSFVWYTPFQGFRGQVTFTYRVTDGSATSFYSADVTINAGAPIGQPESYVVPGPAGMVVYSYEGVLVNDVTWNWTAQSAELLVPPTQGDFHFGSDGSFVYYPHVGFSGVDTFTYRARDFYGPWQPVTVTLSQNPAISWVNLMTGDFNGDGIEDKIGRLRGSNQWWVTLGGDDPLTSRWLIRSPTLAHHSFQVGDVNGDGRDDLLMRLARTGHWLANLSNGQEFQTTVWTHWSPRVAWVDVALGDFNGDGRMDLLGRNRLTNQWWVGLSTSTGVQGSIWATWPARPWTDVRIADVNGDGKDDVIARDAAILRWFIGYSNGRNRFLTRGSLTDPLLD